MVHDYEGLSQLQWLLLLGVHTPKPAQYIDTIINKIYCININKNKKFISTKILKIERERWVFFKKKEIR